MHVLGISVGGGEMGVESCVWFWWLLTFRSNMPGAVALEMSSPLAILKREYS